MLLSYKHIAIPVIFMLSACGRTEDGSSKSNTTAANMQDTTSLVIYRNFIGSLDTANAENITIARQKYNAIFTNNDTVLNDRALSVFETYYTRLMFALNRKLDANKTLIDVPASLNAADISTYPPQLVKYAAVLKNNGFELIESEGSIAIGEDRDFVTKWFYPKVSATMRRFLEQLNKETKEGLQDDEALLISATTLADRAVWWEQFAASQPGFTRSGEANTFRQLYLTILLKGLDNSPVLNYDSHNLTEFYRGAYEHLLSRYPDAAASKLVKPYYEALRAKDDKKAAQIIKEYEDRKLLIW
jgi:hypothetical protein